MVRSSLPAAVRAGALGLALALPGIALAGPAAAAAKVRGPVQRAVVTCAEPSGALEFGGATAQLTFSTGWLEPDDFFVVVPVVDATGLDAGDRVSVDRRQRRATVVVPADGAALTPASTLEVRRGGDVLQRIPVAPGCGVFDPAPQRGPVIDDIVTEVEGQVSVHVTNGSTVADEIGVTLWPVGENTGHSRGLSLPPAGSGVVTFPDVVPGSYTVEASGYTTFKEVTSKPFTVG